MRGDAQSGEITRPQAERQQLVEQRIHRRRSAAGIAGAPFGRIGFGALAFVADRDPGRVELAILAQFPCAGRRRQRDLVGVAGNDEIAEPEADIDVVHTPALAGRMFRRRYFPSDANRGRTPVAQARWARTTRAKRPHRSWAGATSSATIRKRRAFRNTL